MEWRQNPESSGVSGLDGRVNRLAERMDGRVTRVLAFGILVALTALPSHAQDESGRRLPFSDDIALPAPLPVPLDRHLRGEIVEFDGERIKLRWDWSDPAHLEDFDPFIPVRSGLTGDFRVVPAEDTSSAIVKARGTAGIRLRLGMVSDLSVRTDAKLIDPHDLGVVLVKPDVSDESILCLVQDRFFTRFDGAAGNSTMINKMGGIPATAPGVTEFRYIDRKKQPKLAPGDHVELEVLRTVGHTTFTITPDGKKSVKLAGDDTDTAMTRFTPGLYVAAARADFGPLEIEGKLDPEWFPVHDVLPHVASDLLHPGNGFKGKSKTAAQMIERYLVQDATAAPPEDAKDGKNELVDPADVGRLVGLTDLPLVIRIRAAESLMERGAADGDVVRSIARLLYEGDRAARLLAWQVVRPELPWHFRYEVDAKEADRKEASELIGHYLREREDSVAEGKVFVDGYWFTPARADAVRGNWETPWDLRTEHVRIRTNLPKEWADWYLAGLEAAYTEMVRVIGREPPREALPLSVLVFREKAEFEAFCDEHDEYTSRKAWGRFEDMDRGVAFIRFDKRYAPYWSFNYMAKLFLHEATGTSWPTWFSEGRASWFGNPTYRTAGWDGSSYSAGHSVSGIEARLLRAAAAAGDLEDVSTFLARDPRKLDGQDRRLWYVQAWALHHWLMSEAPAEAMRRFARWQQAMEERAPSPGSADSEGRRLFLSVFAGQVETVDEGLREFLGRLE